MALKVAQDLPRSPQNLSDEELKFNSLRLQTTSLSTSGNSTWTSTSSGITYPATTGGDAQLLSVLATALNSYLFNAVDYNNLLKQIVNMKRKYRMWGIA